ncbi:MAG: Unknown protein [uncultured Thiotrichaceae bacterium]|uniref:DNA-binding response regulator n=1 Tax=uncultured Thiotrichaceae bacterium TaxID=298394 RepID=A0A6S6TTR1_9GAMM|nr:MAG: Unknown protein [uncultured Thiotrichaceae bacterium]
MNTADDLRGAQTTKNILVVDDDEILNHFLNKFFANHHYGVTFSENGESLALRLERQSFDLIVLDVVLPGRDGFYWLKWLKEYYPHVPVIISSGKTDKQHRLQGLQGGAKDYIIKPFHEEELLIRINHIFETSLGVKPELSFKIGTILVDIRNSHLIKADNKIPLTQLEIKLLQLLKLNIGIPVSREDIITQIRGVKYSPLDRSIDVHINKLRKKIEDNPAQPRYIRTVRGKGYCLHIN